MNAEVSAGDRKGREECLVKPQGLAEIAIHQSGPLDTQIILPYLLTLRDDLFQVHRLQGLRAIEPATLGLVLPQPPRIVDSSLLPAGRSQATRFPVTGVET